ncbi:MAG: DUF2958 domain-containing protein [Candidatus Saganbacteria bacterium]|nr:DUF2958 domain-containing protein [Candidatus Saganbacteria bacterium]
MELLTDELLEEFKKQGDTSNKTADEVRVIAKFFNPTGVGTWFATEYDPVDRVFFGFANLGDSEMAELGTFSLDELQEYRGRFGLGIERDLHFHNHTLKEVMDARGMMH